MSLTHQDMKLEFLRRKSRRQSLLLTFKRRRQLTTKDLEHFGTGVSSRIRELRQNHIIVTTYIKPGLYRYTYLGEREDS